MYLRDISEVVIAAVPGESRRLEDVGEPLARKHLFGADGQSGGTNICMYIYIYIYIYTTRQRERERERERERYRQSLGFKRHESPQGISAHPQAHQRHPTRTQASSWIDGKDTALLKSAGVQCVILGLSCASIS